jgi:hypothetical protein
MQFADTLNSLGIPAWYIDCGSMIQAADGDLNKSTRKLIEKQIRVSFNFNLRLSNFFGGGR